MTYQQRLDFALEVARAAGDFAAGHFRSIDSLSIESKGHQDLVSNADKETETLVRDAIEARWPDDGIVGEEHGRKHGTSGFDWVIDPIDGTANFVRGIPQWCVAIACTEQGRPVIGVINEPSSGELFHAVRGGGAFVNGKPMRAVQTGALTDGSIGAGVSGRTDKAIAVAMVERILGDGGLFFRNASGALSLAYVAAGRLLGFIEDHMNSWDCLAGLLMIEEAGGTINDLDTGTTLDNGTKVVAGGPNVYPALARMADELFVAR
ncbi:MAG: inositol monophosphatase [Roseitalea sp.]|nr:inositol monophosphatase [Roseitalea sp.]MBO6723858.1 inositol monophosphatase [Roseitalea sp.]MBO6745209.1 inositol monophosphatase [Roseitalea sp.]